jgi:hypothetical protein
MWPNLLYLSKHGGSYDLFYARYFSCGIHACKQKVTHRLSVKLMLFVLHEIP